MRYKTHHLFDNLFNMPLDFFLAYFVILFVATITPGPNSVLAINHGVNHGMAKTIYSGLGNLFGNLLLAVISLLGLGAILLASEVLFSVIKWGGILYLLTIGCKLLFEPVSAQSPAKGFSCPVARKGKYRLFLDGFLIAIGNPKGILFFTALFPQFIHVKSAGPVQFFIIFTTLSVVGFGCYMLYAGLGVRLQKLFQKQTFTRKFNRISGSIFIGTGLAMAFSRK